MKIENSPFYESPISSNHGAECSTTCPNYFAQNHRYSGILLSKTDKFRPQLWRQNFHENPSIFRAISASEFEIVGKLKKFGNHILSPRHIYRQHYEQQVVEFTYIAPLCDGNLETLFTPNETIKMLESICPGLDAIAREGLIHGNLKPTNILVKESRGSKSYLIGDLGLVGNRNQIITPPEAVLHSEKRNGAN